MYCVNCGKKTTKIANDLVECENCKAVYLITVTSEIFVDIFCNFSGTEERKIEELYNRTLIEG
jgi:uncharacterized Zn finger protein